MVKPLHFSLCSGIGDISWVYSKLVTLGRPLDLHVVDGPHRRSKTYLSMLPLVQTVEFSDIPTSVVLDEGHIPTANVPRVLSVAETERVPLQLNTHLERGQRLENYWADVKTDYHYPINIADKDVKQATDLLGDWKRYIVVYMANAKTASDWGGWGAAQWAELADKLVPHYDLDGIVIIGARWDTALAAAANARMSVPTISMVGQLDVGGTLEIIKRSAYMVGFPSGMPILASTMNKKVMMFYPKHLVKMQEAWADPAHIESGHYKGCQFCPPGQALDWIIENHKEL